MARESLDSKLSSAGVRIDRQRAYYIGDGEIRLQVNYFINGSFGKVWADGRNAEEAYEACARKILERHTGEDAPPASD